MHAKSGYRDRMEHRCRAFVCVCKKLFSRILKISDRKRFFIINKGRIIGKEFENDNINVIFAQLFQ